MRVGLLLRDHAPGLGGGYTYQEDLFRSFLGAVRESPHEFHMICEPGYAEELTRSIQGLPNVKAAPLGAPVVPRLAQAPLRIMRRILQRQADAPSREAKLAAERRLELLWSLGHYPHRAFDVPYITTVLDLQHRLQPWFPEVSAGAEWQGRENYFSTYLPRAACVITGTEEGRRQIERFYGVPPARIRVLPLATPAFALAGASVDAKPRLAALGLGRPYLFYPAQFWSHKNHVNLLRALRILHDEHRLPYELVLAGSDRGNEGHVRKAAQTLGLAAHVRFLGFVPQDDLVALYRGAEALAFVTYFGPDNLPPLEAFALGCPVVASAVAGAEEQLGDAALLVPPGSPAEIAAAVKRLRDDPALAQTLRERGRRRAAAWTGADYIGGLFRIIDEFEAVRRCWT